MKLRFIVIVVATGALGGCGSAAHRKAEAEYYAAQADAVRAHSRQEETPLLNLQMSDDGKVRSLIVGRQIGAVPQMTLPADPNVQMVREVVGGAVAVGSIVAGGNAAKGLVTATGRAIGGALQSMPQAVVVQQPAPVQIPGAPAPEVVVVRPDVVNPVVVNPVVVDPVLVPPTIVETAP